MKKKLKIAVFHNLPASGALKALQDNVNIFKKEGHIVDIYTTDVSDGEFAPLKDYSDNYYVYPLKRSKSRKVIFSIIEKLFYSGKFHPDSRIFFKFNDFKNTLKAIAEDIDSKDYDFVYLDQDFIFTVAPIISKYINTLKIYYCHQPPRNNEEILIRLSNRKNRPIHLRIYDKLFNEKYDKLDVEAAQCVDYMLCNSYHTHENILRSYGMNSKVSYLGINSDQFQALNLPRKNIVLSVGAIGPHKGFHFIIKSLAKVDDNIRPKFIIVGYASDKQYLNYLKSLANDLNVELEFLQGIPYEDLVKLYNEVKIVIFAPYVEAFGLIPLEAFACGTPVIGVKEGGVRETVVHGENGLLLDRDESTFAEGIAELLTNQELWNKCSKNGPKYIDDFWTLDHAGERLLKNIYKILEDENKK